MTRERVRELLPIMQAYAEGKTIQFLDGGNWYDVYDTDFYKSPDRYRIKPEPKYRPFKTQEECWEEMHKHSDFGWLKSKQSGSFATIGAIIQQEEDSVRVRWSTNETQNFTASAVFNDYTFTDGTPFGVKEEGK